MWLVLLVLYVAAIAAGLTLAWRWARRKNRELNSSEPAAHAGATRAFQRGEWRKGARLLYLGNIPSLGKRPLLYVYLIVVAIGAMWLTSIALASN
jgi:hypothetical protein